MKGKEEVKGKVNEGSSKLLSNPIKKCETKITRKLNIFHGEKDKNAERNRRKCLDEVKER